MKPRIYRRHGVWVCRSLRYMFGGEDDRVIMGHGYTPREAYAAWKAQL